MMIEEEPKCFTFCVPLWACCTRYGHTAMPLRFLGFQTGLRTS
jgi:hypothetical protein